MIMMPRTFLLIFVILALFMSVVAVQIPSTSTALFGVKEAVNDNFLNSKAKAVALDQEITQEKKNLSLYQSQLTLANSAQKQALMKTIESTKTELYSSLFNKLVTVQAQAFSSIHDSKKLSDRIQQLSSLKRSDASFNQKVKEFNLKQQQLEATAKKINSRLESLESSKKYSTELSSISSDIRIEIKSLKELFILGKDIAKTALRN